MFETFGRVNTCIISSLRYSLMTSHYVDQSKFSDMKKMLGGEAKHNPLDST